MNRKFKHLIISIAVLFSMVSVTYATDTRVGDVGTKSGAQNLLYEKYANQIEEGISPTFQDGNLYQEMTQKKSRSTSLANTEDFKDFLSVANGENELEKIDEYQEGDNIAIIAIDKETNSKLYVEVSNSDNTIFLDVNGTNYYIEKDAFAIYLVSANGNKILLSETYYSDAIKVNNLPTEKSRATSLKDTVYYLGNDKAYSKDIGPMSTTNKSLLKAIELLGKATGLIKASHPILGIISFVCKAGVKVGNTFYQTFYIRFWRAFQLNVSGGLTRNKERWFSDSSCSNASHIKDYTSYFNATRPGY